MSLIPNRRVLRAAVKLLGVLVVVALLSLAWMRARGPWVNAEYAATTIGSIEFGTGFHGPITFHIEPPPLQAPPRGTERLRGRLTLDGAGIEGAKVTLSLNSKYHVVLDSDSRGAFEARLPAGEWHINDVAVSDWNDRPRDRELLLFSGHEPRKRGGQYSGFDSRLVAGLPISLPADSNATSIELEFRDALQITWPPKASAGTDAEFSTAAITWLPVAGASEYEVHIAHLNYPQFVSIESILTRHVSGLTLPLAELPQRTPTAVEDAYAVHIYAFDADGRLLTESNTKSVHRTFRLSGATRLGKEQQYIDFDGPRIVISAEYELNQTRLKMVKRLLDQKRFDDARRMLDLITNDAPRGEASALRAKFAALQGDCVTANKLFDKAQAEGGCVSDEERKLCD